jgi:hypothetical protein
MHRKRRGHPYGRSEAEQGTCALDRTSRALCDLLRRVYGGMTDRPETANFLVQIPRTKKLREALRLAFQRYPQPRRMIKLPTRPTGARPVRCGGLPGRARRVDNWIIRS